MTNPLPDPLLSYVNGVNLEIDGGFMASMTTGQVDFSKYNLGS